ncbi:MICOS complex subunit MIC19 [Sabethes cyaneus]|uniref:MICOS complex subunit MIC19 n=1 Tax=Sabethes cyaneus TaxID=53552 RepID=UPI00237D82FF|nr:MICOS complex subunit MIC19 [Sabethes cyaneus]
MGASSSTPRTVTIDNDSPVGVIDISDDVVQRLKTGIPPKEGARKHSSAPSSYPNPIPPPAGYHEPALSSKENNDHLAKRLEILEARSSVIEKEYNNAMIDVKKHFKNTATSYQLPPCQDLKAKVIECYKKNQNETLNCSADVKLFTDCVNLHRIQLLQKKEEATKSAKAE